MRFQNFCEPGRVFDRMVNLDEVPDGYRDMDERKAIKVKDVMSLN